MRDFKRNYDGGWPSRRTKNSFIQREAAARQKEVLPFISKERIASVQAKLIIGNPDDRYEREAESMAEYVMRKPAKDKPPLFISRIGANGLQRKCRECEEEMAVQRKESSGESQAPHSLSRRLQSRQGMGNSLPQSVQGQMEQSFGADFSNVRVHTDNEAAGMSRALGARAFTHGADVYFNRGEYDPTSSKGRRLLGHELTHVVQQANNVSANKQIQRQTEGPTIGALPESRFAEYERIRRTFEIQVVQVHLLAGGIGIMKIDFRIRRQGTGRWVDAHFFGGGGGVGLGSQVSILDRPGQIQEVTVPHPMEVFHLFGRAQVCGISVPFTNISGFFLRLTSGPASYGFSSITWNFPDSIGSGGVGCFFGRFEGGH